MFQHSFMVIAFVAIILLGFILPLIGLNMTTKRLSMIGDTISHTSLCGVAIALACGSLPIPWAIGVSIIAGLIIEVIRDKFSKYSELTLSIVMSTAVGIVGILTSYVQGNSFEKYLFGSIFLISMTDLYILIGITRVVVVYNLILYRTNLYISYSSNEARTAGIHTKIMNLLNIVIASASIAVSSTIIGSLLVSSLLVIPVAISLQIFKGYFHINIFSILISVVNGLIGLIISYYVNVNGGGMIVVINSCMLLLVIVGKFVLKFTKKFSKNQAKKD